MVRLILVFTVLVLFLVFSSFEILLGEVAGAGLPNTSHNCIPFNRLTCPFISDYSPQCGLVDYYAPIYQPNVVRLVKMYYGCGEDH